MLDAAEAKFESLIRTPLFRVILSGLVLCLLAFFYRAIAVASSDTSPINTSTVVRAMVSGLPFALLGFFFALAMFWSFFRSTGAEKVVLWLRRFHQNEPTRFPMPKYFTLLGAGWFQVATIQDTRFKTAFVTGATRSILAVAAIQVLLAVPFLLLSIYVTSRFLNFPAAERSGSIVPIGVALLLTPVLQACVAFPTFLLLARRRGVVVLKGSADVMRVTYWMDRVHNGIGHLIPGLKIFKCGDAFWEDAVTAMLMHCDAAIIDITDLNKNTRWELRQCMALVDVEHIVLAYGVGLDRYPADPDDIKLDELEAEIGMENLGKVMFWPYPEPLPIKGNRPVLDYRVEADVIRTLKITLSHVLDGVPIDETPPESAEPNISCGPRVLDAPALCARQSEERRRHGSLE